VRLIQPDVTTIAGAAVSLGQAPEAPPSQHALDALRSASDGLRQRLLRLIHGSEPCSMLVGTGLLVLSPDSTQSEVWALMVIGAWLTWKML
jgi:hypothetical protein